MTDWQGNCNFKGGMADITSVRMSPSKEEFPVSAKVVAEYIISLANPEEGEIISHLKLQKLLYYCQGFHLAIHGAPLFKEKIYNWVHGPVVKEIYHEYKKFGSDALKPITDGDFSELSEPQKATIKEVYDVYGQFSAWKLRQMTHAEEPWCTTQTDQEITLDMLRNFFLKQVA